MIPAQNLGPRHLRWPALRAGRESRAFTSPGYGIGCRVAVLSSGRCPARRGGAVALLRMSAGACRQVRQAIAPRGWGAGR